MAKVPADSIARSPKRSYSIFRSLRFGRLDAERREIMDPVPIQPPIGYKKAPSLSEQIRDMVRNEKLAQELAAQGAESFEEADDFDIPDDPVDPSSPYEADFEGDAAAALLDANREPEPILTDGHRTYGHVEEFVKAHPEFDPRNPRPEQLRPEPTPYQKGVGEDVIAPGETPPSPTRASAEPQKSPWGFPLRRG